MEEKAYPISMHPGFMKVAKDRGFVKVGQGSFKTVFRAAHHPGKAFICFSVDEHKHALKTMNAVYRYGRSVEGKADRFIPRFYGRDTSTVGGVKIVMFSADLLLKVKTPRPWVNALWNKLGNHTAIGMASEDPDFLTAASRKNPFDIRQAMNVTDQGAADSLLHFTDYMALEFGDARFDISKDNLMQRPDGHLVFNDIWC
jgi:hypothetical protein